MHVTSSAAVLAVINRDSSSYRTGEVIGVLLVLALGAALLVKGLRGRRKAAYLPPLPAASTAPAYSYDRAPTTPPATDPTPPPAPPSSQPGDFFYTPPAAPTPSPAPMTTWAPTPPPPPQGGSTGFIVAGAIVLLLGVVGAIRVLPDLSYPKRTIAIPTSLLGEPRNAQATAQLRSQLLGSLPKEVKSSDVAAFGAGATPDLVVIVGTGHLSSPSAEIADFRKGVVGAGTFTLTDERSVPAGPLGGAAKCFDARVGAVSLEVCAFVDRGSFLATIDRTADPALAASRALETRNAVIHSS